MLLAVSNKIVVLPQIDLFSKNCETSMVGFRCSGLSVPLKKSALQLPVEGRFLIPSKVGKFCLDISGILPLKILMTREEDTPSRIFLFVHMQLKESLFYTLSLQSSITTATFIGKAPSGYSFPYNHGEHL